jgi:N-acetylmuramoyl-L-alanine amidase
MDGADGFLGSFVNNVPMKRFVGFCGALVLLLSGDRATAQPSVSVSQASTTRDPSAGAASQPVVMDVRVGEHADRTRFVVELSDPVKLRVFTLATPDRVVIDLPEVLWRAGGPDHPSGKGVVKSYRYGLFRPGNSRFVIDLNTPVVPAEPLLLPPAEGHGYRVVLDLVPTAQTRFQAAAGWPADLRARENAAEKLAGAVGSENPAHERHVIVIDAGHGGIDSGTTGVNGSMEKDLVLDEALRLQKLLVKRGYAVYLTRDSDVYIPLGERVEIARTHRADLFISLHADSNPDSGVSGASVYTLSEAGTDKEAAALARKENQSDVIAGVDLTGQDGPVASILIGLAQRDTINRSAHFAQNVVTQLGRATDVLQREPHRSAAFVVLKAPDVPAVLIELGYLSNAQDCTQMSEPGWREEVAVAISNAVDRQFRAASGAPLRAEAAE